MLARSIGAPLFFLVAAACSSTSTNVSNSTGGTSSGGSAGTGGDPVDAGGSGGTGGDAGAGGTGGSAHEGPSCEGLDPCGSGDSCCRNVLLPAGEFHRDNVNGDQYLAKVSAFRLDAYEVTVGRFRKFVTANPPAPAVGSGKHTHVASATSEQGWVSALSSELPLSGHWEEKILQCGVDTATAQPTFTVTPGANERHPMNCVSFAMAYAFCIWDGGFLPTDAELAYAYVNGAKQDSYPWGNEPPTPALATYFYGASASALLPVGGKAKTGAGFFDLAGSVYEFSLDAYSALGSGYPLSPCVDCVHVDELAPLRVIRGGGYLNTPEVLKAGDPNHRLGFYQGGNNVGFRCARSP